MASSEEDNNNNNNNDREMGFQYRGEMSSGSMFNKSSSGSGNLFGSDWDPLENFAGLSGYPVGLENHQGLVQRYQSGSGSGSAIGELIPKLGSFGSGSFSEMNDERDERNNDEKRHRIESRSKQIRKEAKDNGDSEGAPKENYVHVRAKRGQATNSHSLAERVRREKISERMKLLQDLVPGCNKITGKAVMLDEIINYVQSLQQQVEFLSMKLATVNPEMNVDIDRLVYKDILQSQGSSLNPAFGFGPTLSSSHSYPHGSLTGIPSTAATMHPIHPQPVWDNDLHNLLQMGCDANATINNLGPNDNRR